MSAEKLVSKYEEAWKKNAKRGARKQGIKDYIKNPKPSGYRGIHIVCRYHNPSHNFSHYNDLKIEIQLRSKLQHLWAMAVETVDLFTGQALKSNIGKMDWKRFFVLVSNEFARIEKRPLVPDAPLDEAVSKDELRLFPDQISAIRGFRVAHTVLTAKESKAKGAQTVLLVLDLEKHSLRFSTFQKEQEREAQAHYTETERANESNKSIQTVLVSVDSLAALPKAYPSFYLDTGEFVQMLNRLIAD